MADSMVFDGQASGGRDRSPGYYAGGFMNRRPQDSSTSKAHR
jgi:hypothetical protein